MIILRESNFKDIVSEFKGEGANKKWYLKGIFMMAEHQNRNGRIYPLEEIQKGVNKINSSLSSGEDVLGALDHPNDLEVRLKDASHRIKEIKMEGNNAVGTAQILSTPNGIIAQALIKDGIKVGFSSRGSGHVNESTGLVENFDLITIDLVAVPSAQNAYPESVFESLRKYKGYSEIVELSKILKEDITAQKYFNRSIKKFIEETFKK